MAFLSFSRYTVARDDTTPTGKSRGYGVAGAGVYNPRLHSTKLAPFCLYAKSGAQPPSLEYPLLLSPAERAIYFYKRVATARHVPIGGAQSTSCGERRGSPLHPTHLSLASTVYFKPPLPPPCRRAWAHSRRGAQRCSPAPSASSPRT